MTMTAEIALTQGQVAIVDATDYGWLSQWKWCASKHGHTFRAQRSEYLGAGSQRCLFMHRAIMQPDAGSVVDHINHNPLDNRRANLRICTRGENQRNTTSRKSSTSQFIGVDWHKSRSVWRARIKAGDRHLYLGDFSTEIEAAKAYDAAARQHFGAFANPNFGATQ